MGYLPGQQVYGGWRVRGSGRVREDSVSKSRSSAHAGQQVPRMMDLIDMKEESYF